MSSSRPMVSCVVLTRNEEMHIRRCLRSARRVADQIYVVDSHSSDLTRAIAEEEGAIVRTGNFSSFAQKLNWAIDTIDFASEWVLRLDADEVLSDRLVAQLKPFLARQPASVSGVFVRRRLWFMARPIRHGGMYPRHTMRLWRPRAARCEIRALDEHMLLKTGDSATVEADIEDIPLTGLAAWIAKHNEYSDLEAMMTLAEQAEDQGLTMQSHLFGTKNERMRWLKEKIFYKFPPFVRPVFYYLYRYILLFGFLDGKAGLIFHFLHGFWYRFIVDAKIVEARWQGRGKEHVVKPEAVDPDNSKAE